jgi:hypothetical protein
MSAALDWTVHQLTPVIDWLSQVVTEQHEILAMAERGKCPKIGEVPRRDKADLQWQEVFKDAIMRGYLETLMLEAEAKAEGLSGEDFTRCVQKVGARRLTELVGVDFAELRNQIATLLEAGDLRAQVAAAAAVRETVLRLREALDDHIAWQALTAIEKSKNELQDMREQFVVMCLNIVSAADYMIAAARPFPSPSEPSDPEAQRMYVADRGRIKTSFSDDDDKQLRRIVDARITLAIELRRFWYALKESVELAP